MLTVEAANEEHQNEDVLKLTALERNKFLLLKSEHAQAKAEIVTLKSKISALKSDNATLKVGNAALIKDLEERKTVNFTEAFLKEKENGNILKFYTGTYIDYVNLQFNVFCL